MRRRRLIAVGLLCLLAAAAADAQQRAQSGKVARIGILATGPLRPIASLRQALRELGYAEGENLRIEHRWAEGHDDRYPLLAAELVALRVDAIVTWGTPAALAAKRATATIPIVMGAIGDPTSVVANLAHPGGNITGFTSLSGELEEKRLELLKELLPRLAHIGVLSNPSNPFNVAGVERVRATAASMGLTLEMAGASEESELDAALATLHRARPDAALVLADTFLISQHRRIISFMAESRLPTAYSYREFAEAGGLLAYVADYDDLFRRAAAYVDRILKGAAPGDLPVQQPTRFELVVNLETAKALGLAVPPSLLARADEVIE